MEYLKFIGIFFGAWVLYYVIVWLVHTGFATIIDWFFDHAPVLFFLIILAFCALCVYIISQWF